LRESIEKEEKECQEALARVQQFQIQKMSRPKRDPKRLWGVQCRGSDKREKGGEGDPAFSRRQDPREVSGLFSVLVQLNLELLVRVPGILHLLLSLNIVLKRNKNNRAGGEGLGGKGGSLEGEEVSG
jgi:hypothetical protein